MQTSENFTLRWVRQSHGIRLGISFFPGTKSAVVRNRAKRIFREIFRLERENLDSEVDIHITVRQKKCVSEVEYNPLLEEFISACKKAGIWNEK